VRAGEDGDLDRALADPVTVDVTLHEEGWFARFLTERGPLLPEDEARLGASWLLVDRTVFQVLAVRSGEGLDLRDLRTDEPGHRHRAHREPGAAGRPAVRPRRARRRRPPARRRGAGGADRPGAGPAGPARRALRRAGAGVGGGAVGPAAAAHPDEPGARECTARLRLDPDAADVLDEAYQPAGDGWVRLDDEDRVLAALDLRDDVLTVRTLTGPLLDAVLGDLAVELPEARILTDDPPPS
jgi:hypothetical protein